MKVLVGFSRVFVGVLFIISGFIKLNDPLGFSYKLQEYFGTDVLNLPFLEPYALGISVIVVVFEVVLGVFSPYRLSKKIYRMEFVVDDHFFHVPHVLFRLF